MATSSLDEVFSIFQSVYEKLNGRDTSTTQKHELVLLCHEETFELFCAEIVGELRELRADDTPGSVWDFLRAQEYVPGEQVEKAERNDPQAVQTVLYQLLIDLQCERLVAGRAVKTSLSIDAGDATVVNQIGGKMQRIAHKLGLANDSVAGQLRQLADHTLPPPSPSLLMPIWNLNVHLTERLLDIIDEFNREYLSRRTVLSRRLDVTIEAFLRSPHAEKSFEQINDIVQKLKWKNETQNVGMWHLLSASGEVLARNERISSRSTRSAVKSVIIGHVPDRGGVPEGYTVEDIGKDVTKANVMLTKKDGGGGNFGRGMTQATVKRWTGAGMGIAAEGGGKGDKGGKGGKKGGGGDYGFRPERRNSGDQNSGASYYGSKGSPRGGGGSYYNQKGGGGGGGGGSSSYYDQKGGGGGGSSFYDQKGGGGGGSSFYDQKGSGGSSSSFPDRGGGGSSYYDSKGSSSKDSYGGGGGYYDSLGSGGRSAGFGGRSNDRAATSKGWKKK